ncbi:hypothetical protein [Halalkalibacter sp. APA_J-10(15)]|uniref:hypothetical protein n=1 Tax=Halalkalibacter sp. APA_J-10(15) TaxID=2933805 RepID=UPI001FF33243|nr:hypothetical protein [Halalkalibacter sp. APA_J-10(15)]MCK0471682.1 hypothetical protein [Halalkalibacter sp. APA_J-10(15)]
MLKSYKWLGSLLVAFLLVLVTACGTDTSGTEGDAGKSEEDVATNEEEDAVENEDSEPESPEQTTLGDYVIDFSGRVIEEGQTFIIEGQSNLIAGSRLIGEVLVDEGETIYSDSTELVREDGSFYIELDHHQYGEAEIIVRMDFDSVQEDHVIRHYGDRGQNLDGPFIYRHKVFNNIYKKAEAKVFYDPSDNNELVIQAPDWYELPEDYGDPRVWIEVDDIQEDGEYFYIHGRSNLLEGSEIKAEYRYNRDTTQVLPDGSFNFKFDYEYLEDRDIVITFEPYNFQWNEIEEAYGANGQRLVGNLVQTNQYNTDRQYVEKRIPWDEKRSESGSSNEPNTMEDSDEDLDDIEDLDSDEEDVDSEEDEE